MTLHLVSFRCIRFSEEDERSDEERTTLDYFSPRTELSELPLQMWLRAGGAAGGVAGGAASPASVSASRKKELEPGAQAYPPPPNESRNASQTGLAPCKFSEGRP